MKVPYTSSSRPDTRQEVFARSSADALEHDPQEPTRMHASPDAEEEEEEVVPLDDASNTFCAEAWPPTSIARPIFLVGIG
jgi:hypothetical protein